MVLCCLRSNTLKSNSWTPEHELWSVFFGSSLTSLALITLTLCWLLITHKVLCIYLHCALQGITGMSPEMQKYWCDLSFKPNPLWLWGQRAHAVCTTHLCRLTGSDFQTEMSTSDLPSWPARPDPTCQESQSSPLLARRSFTQLLFCNSW